VLVLLPEIALTQPFLKRFAARFGCEPVAWHSDLRSSQRRRAWRGIASGEAKVVVGARSALFLPYAKLGLIVVDEAHEPSFKQEEGVQYHARDVAVMRPASRHLR
jgi:primosomal protein N' (replication factor Y)